MTDITAGPRPHMERLSLTRRLRPAFRATRAELFRLRKWPALWVTVSAELALNLLFLYVFTYISYRSSDTAAGLSGGVGQVPLLADLVPAAIPRVATQGMPMFAGALVLLLGALAAGSGYSWGTIKTATLQGPSRLANLAGLLTALSVIVVGLVAVLFTMDAGLSLLVANLEHQPVVWPASADAARSFGSGVLIMGMWTFGGVLIGTWARSPALAVGLGLVWVLAIENLLRGVGSLWSPLEQLADVLPGTAAGSLVGSLGATPMSEAGGTPGVLTTLSGGTAAWLLVTYCLLFAAITGWLTQRRDLS